MVSMSIDRKIPNKDIQQAEIKSLNESAYETIEDFIVQVKKIDFKNKSYFHLIIVKNLVKARA